jgi:hypothetical protein
MRERFALFASETIGIKDASAYDCERRRVSKEATEKGMI